MKEIIAPICQAISEGFKLIRSRMDSAESRKKDACIEAGEKYIFTNEDTGLTPERKEKLLSHFKRRFFVFN